MRIGVKVLESFAGKAASAVHVVGFSSFRSEYIHVVRGRISNSSMLRHGRCPFPFIFLAWTPGLRGALNNVSAHMPVGDPQGNIRKGSRTYGPSHA